MIDYEATIINGLVGNAANLFLILKESFSNQTTVRETIKYLRALQDLMERNQVIATPVMLPDGDVTLLYHLPGHKIDEQKHGVTVVSDLVFLQ